LPTWAPFRGPSLHDAMEREDWLEAHILRRDAEKQIEGERND
jgi:hypothetical protein